MFVGSDFIRENTNLIQFTEQSQDRVMFYALSPLDTTHDYLARERATVAGVRVVEEWSDLNGIPKPTMFVLSNSIYYCSKYLV